MAHRPTSRQMNMGSPSARLIPLRAHTLAGQVAAYIRLHVYENPESVQINRLARRFSCGAKSLSLHFRSRYNTTIHAYALQIRHAKFCQQLLAGVNIKLIAIEAGYTELCNFTRDFKRIAGVSPRQYIEQHKRYIHTANSHPLLLRETS